MNQNNETNETVRLMASKITELRELVANMDHLLHRQGKKGKVMAESPHSVGYPRPKETLLSVISATVDELEDAQ